jgi:pimeloyl-ACP methyl ester carboxylesterase
VLAVLRRTAKVALAALLLLAVVLGAFRAASAWRESADAAPPADGRLVKTPYGNIFTQERGPVDGPPVLLVHGTAAWSGFWLAIAEALGREGYRAIAIDLPPFGFSDRSAEGAYSRRDQAERLSGLIAAANFRRPIVVGHSFGAGPVLEAAMRHADQIRGVILVDGALGLPPEGEDYPPDHKWVRMMISQPMIAEPLVSATMTNPWLTRRLLAGLLYRKDAASEAEVEILQRPFTRHGATAAYARWLPSLLFADRQAMSADPLNYAKINMPVALVWGREDAVTPLEQGERLRRLIPGSTLDAIDGVGHIPHIEDEPAFLTTLTKRLNDMIAH